MPPTTGDCGGDGQSAAPRCPTWAMTPPPPPPQTFMGAAVLISGAAVTAVSHAVTTPYVLALRRLADGSFQGPAPPPPTLRRSRRRRL